MDYNLASFLLSLLAIILTFFGFDYVFVKEKAQRANPTRREFIIGGIATSALAASYIHYKYFDYHAPIQYVVHWGVDPNSERQSQVIVDTTHLTDRASAYNLAAVCFFRTGGDALDLTGLQKSSLYDIDGSDEMIITIPWDATFTDEVLHKGYRGSIYGLLLIPKGVTMDQFSTIRQARALGAISLQILSGAP